MLSGETKLNNIYGESKEEIEKNLLFMNRQIFKNNIEALMMNSKLNIVESIEEYCSEKGVDVEDIFNLIDQGIKDKLEEYAIQRNLFKMEYREPQLPI
jgi:hypothetical protein